MTTTAPTHSRRRSSLPAAGELDSSLAHIRDLVSLRRIFAAYGAGEEELRLCDAEIERERQSVARFARAGAQALRAA